ncbi:MAG TPA: glucose-6-phosphate dehydrogenase [Gemmataceae bacterium]|nr:glucose-6-phosphate dehydrogenase [Gemmataceae bacterium]
MTPQLRPPPTVVVIFGAGGDLTRRKLLPALYNLFLDGWLPERFAVIGLDRRPMDDEQFRRHAREGIDQFSRRGPAQEADWQKFAPALGYQVADFTASASYAQLAGRLAAREQDWGSPANYLFYLAITPTLFETVARQLGEARLVADPQRSRLVVEKPFGRDLASAAALDRSLTDILAERQIFRIDHYLGKQTVQNILAFRFANSIFEPIWDRRYIDQVQITVAEEVGIEHRGGYYDRAGALRDMIQNHLLRVLTLIAMEPPVSFDADEVRSKKLDVLRAIRPIPRDQVDHFAVRGQYGPGTVEGRPVPGYRQEPDVASDSTTETFAAIKLYVDNWRWQGVPFYLRTGKRLAARVAEASIVFRPVPHRTFPPSAVRHWVPNRLVLRIQPDEGILLRFMADMPGPGFTLEPVDLSFSYEQTFHKAIPEAYETLLLDALKGDATLFMRADQVETAWAVVAPIQEAWAAPAADFPNYAAGTWGPAAADALLARDGRHWLLPTALEKGRPQP